MYLQMKINYAHFMILILYHWVFIILVILSSSAFFCALLHVAYRLRGELGVLKQHNMHESYTCYIYILFVLIRLHFLNKNI